ncbi:MAG: hypothetical protein Q8K60_09295 [Parachlamydiaceae bacterium]|nr:hypothetical protein [Parachlamydiaceae bacterium]
MRHFFYFFIRSFCLIMLSLFAFGYAEKGHESVQAFASLTYYLQSQAKSVNEDIMHFIPFTDEQVNALWEKTHDFIYNQRSFYSLDQQLLFETALKEYNDGKNYLFENEYNLAKKHFEQSKERIRYLWHATVDLEFEIGNDKFEDSFEISSIQSNLNCAIDDLCNIDFNYNTHIPSSIQKQFKPYLIPFNHVMKPVLDRLFATRVTQEKKTLMNAGFKIIDRRSRSFICVVSHPDLTGYLLKLYLDRDKRKKYGRPSWEWLVKRCEGAEKIHGIISKFSIKHFVCAKKWIYSLPENPPPPLSKKYTRHLAVLLVKDMQLVSEEENYAAWKNKIREEQLDELYILVTRGKGSSYRPDNLPFTKNGTIAFIDTEYPDKGPDFDSIREFLNTSMRYYWDKIVANGGF